MKQSAGVDKQLPIELDGRQLACGGRAMDVERSHA
jgi:hypothetical protein